MENNTSTKPGKFDHLIESSTTKFLTAAQHLGTIVALQAQKFETMEIPEVIANGLNTSRRYLAELAKLDRSINENSYLVKFVKSRSDSFRTEINQAVTEKFLGKPLKPAFDTDYLLDQVKETALDLFSLLNGQERAICNRVGNDPENINPEVEAELRELGEVLKVLNDVLHAQPKRYWDALYRYN